MALLSVNKTAGIWICEKIVRSDWIPDSRSLIFSNPRSMFETQMPGRRNPGQVLETYDAIVVGSGISGGWAAKELCEKGLKTLVLERGRNVEHIKDYPTAMAESWELPHPAS